MSEPRGPMPPPIPVTRDRTSSPPPRPRPPVGPSPDRHGWLPERHSELGRPSVLIVLLLVLAASVFWFVVGIAVGRAYAAPRPSPQPASVQSGDLSSTHDAMAPGSTGAPRGEPLSGELDASTVPASAGSGAPTPTAEIGSSIESGIASYVAASYGPRYLALPVGPGHRVEICGAGGCVTRTSNDAGPDLEMQRAGRIADLSLADWEHVCGLPALRGTCPVTVEDPAP
jgi:hypothetical protein